MPKHRQAATDGENGRPKKDDPRYQRLSRAVGLQIAQIRRERAKRLGYRDAASVAKAAEMDASTLSQIENGHRLIDTWGLYSLGRVLQVSPGATFLDPVVQYALDVSYRPPPLSPRPALTDGSPGLDVHAAVSDAIYAAVADVFESLTVTRQSRASAQSPGETGRPSPVPSGRPRRRTRAR